MTKGAFCFGEILWDIFPNDKKIGGAPLNVAIRLSSLGVPTAIASKVGKDELGIGILDFAQHNGLATNHIQQSTQFDTGKVMVSIDKEGAATYEIAPSAAWDKIDLNTALLEAVRNCELFIFGSLAARDEVSRKTLSKLLSVAPFTVFDVNLRPPHYSFPLLKELMASADFIKFNHEELTEISQLMGCDSFQLEEQIHFIVKQTNTKNICVTKGSEGALLYLDGKLYTQKSFSITIVDTVGAGDSFLATLLEGFLTNRRPEESLERACAMGALVASRQGANPKITKNELLDFIQTSA